MAYIRFCGRGTVTRQQREPRDSGVESPASTKKQAKGLQDQLFSTEITY